MRAGAFLLVIGSAVATSAATAAGGTVIDMPAPRGQSVETVSAGDSKPNDLGAVALYRYAAARTVPLYSYPSVPLFRPFYGFGFGFGFGFGYNYGFGLGCPFGFGHSRNFGYGYGYRWNSIGFRRWGFRRGLWR